MTDGEKDTLAFALGAIEKLAHALLTGEYDVEEIDGIVQMAGIEARSLRDEIL